MTEWNVEQAKDEIANGGRYGAKRVMEAVYRNNIEVFRHSAGSRRSTRLSADGRKFSERTNMKVDTAARFLAAACVVR